MEPNVLVSMATLWSHNATDASLPATLVSNSTEWLLVQTIVPPYIFTLCVIGLLGNAFVLLVFLLHRGRWTIPEIYLGNLALADLLLLSCLPFWAMNILNNYNWSFGDFLCKTVSLFINLNFYTSMYLLAMISVDRYLALVRTMRARWLRRTRYAKAICFALWLFGLLMGVPSMVHRKVKFVEQTMACILEYPDDSWKLANQVLLNVVGFVLPVLIIVFCSCSIIRSLNQRRENVYTQDVKDRKSTVLVYAVTVLFLVCWGPFQLFTFLDTLCDAKLLDEKVWGHFLNIGNQFSTYLAFLNSSLNPILYVFSGQYFRRKVREISRRTKHRRRSSDVTTYQRSVISTYVNRTEVLKPVVI